jgi:hypothetical protein
MNQTGVASNVKAKLERIAGIMGTTPGRPDEMPAMAVEFPINYYEVGEAASERLTFTTQQHAYDITITHVIGQPSTTADAAQLEKTKWADRYRAAFSGDTTLGGNCLYCQMTSGTNNLDSFRDTGDYPALQWKLLVLEYESDSSAASE